MAQPSGGASQECPPAPPFAQLSSVQVEPLSLPPSAAAHFHSFPLNASRSVFKSNFSASFLS